jgi:hypothetical protein
MGLKAFDIALVGLLAAVYAAMTLLPGFPMIGAPGTDIDLARSLDVGYGLILGIALGPLASFMGSLVGKALSGGGIGFLFTPPAIATSLLAASLTRERVGPVKGWHVAAATLAIPMAVWFLLPLGREAWPYAMLHAAGLAEILLLRGWLTGLLKSEDRRRLVLGILLTSYPATMAGHMVGTLIFVFLLGPTAGFFIALTLITLIERVAISIIATAIGVPLVVAMRGMGRRRGAA